METVHTSNQAGSLSRGQSTKASHISYSEEKNMLPVKDPRKYWKDTLEHINEALKMCFEPIQRAALLDRKKWYENALEGS
ncbi:hypothetical protein AU106_gp174 [Sinorhizobium phage phiM9]|uniref:Uncharacterized protein n=1 Tax=Sinorhizobium phage phiM9 TaxID=1636182 RepID=A0A0F6R605_9CAUD|nr:hypothetical protein AU106_gp174 [Sinorhizobium phage phiM9]AKE44805.1 hypothetical protein Sm_phiM9_178 [Sinorhizobium phage phiM9]